MFCKYCGKEIADDSVFCSSCGKQLSGDTAPVQPKEDPQKEAQQKSNTRRCPKCGNTLDASAPICKYCSHDFTRKKPAIPAWVIVILVILVVGSCGKSRKADTPEPVSTIAKNPEELFLTDFCAVSSLPQDMAADIYTIVRNDLHFDSVAVNSHQDSEGTMNWWLTADGYDVVVTADPDGIYGIFIPDLIRLYDNGSVVATKADIASREIPSEDRSAYIVMAKDLLEQMLVSPSTAEYCSSSELVLKRNGSIVTMSGWVDSQNSFGAMIRSDFVVQMNVTDLESLAATLIYIQIGDQSAGEYIEMN